MRSKSDQLRIVVSGLAATYPFGGVFWDYLQYAVGFRLLGHDVLYLEDTGNWGYDPENETFVDDGAKSAAYLAKHLQEIPGDMADRWHYRDGAGNCFGRSAEYVREFCRTADLFLNISASCWMREDYLRAGVVGFLDSDPMYTQASIPDYVAGTVDPAAKSRIEEILAHDAFFTFAENIYGEDCLVPRELIRWLPTRQPVLFDFLHQRRVPVAERRRVLTTIGSWEPSQKPLFVRGKRYYGKSHELLRFAHLAGGTALPIELAMSGNAASEDSPLSRWSTIPAFSVSKDPWVYLDYLSHSFAEWSVAKNAYVESRSGWFSCRTACYLAMGVPAVVQDTGFSKYIPCGRGLFAFSTEEEAREGIAEVAAHPEAHARSAAELAREYFDYRTILTRLLERAFDTSHRKTGVA